MKSLFPMFRLLIVVVLVTVPLMLVACQPVVLLPSDAPLASDAPMTDEETTTANQIAFDGKIYTVGEEVWGMVSDDLNGDGLPDLAVADAASGGIGVFLNPGDGTFANGVTFATGEAPNSVTPIDADGDGDLDLAVANGGSGIVTVLTNDGSGQFEVSAEYEAAPAPWWVFAADLNNDGHPDLGMAHEPQMAGILLNTGDGTFQAIDQFVVGEYGGNGSIGAADVNGNGIPDLIARHWPASIVSVMTNLGDGTFEPPVDYAIEGEPHGGITADLDGDGAVDLIVPTGGDEEPGLIHVLMNDGEGHFAPDTSFEIGPFPLDVETIDLDGDTDLDLLVTSCGSEAVVVLNNDGDGRFKLASEIVMGVCPVMIDVLDVDGVAGPEMVVSSFDGSVMVMTLPDGLGQTK